MSSTKYSTYSLPIFNYLVNTGLLSRRILDVGCWTGALGDALRKEHKALEIDGIDLDRAALQKAKGNGYRHVYQADLNDPEALQNIQISDRYDVIVFGDVLEHTVNPEQVLNLLRPLLSKEGIIAISLPNIGFVYYRLTHLFGRWEYKETGVMDRTHLRFFTLNSATRFISELGFEIIARDYFIGISNRPKLVRSTMKWLSKKLPSLFAMQMVFYLKDQRQADL